MLIELSEMAELSLMQNDHESTAEQMMGRTAAEVLQILRKAVKLAFRNALELEHNQSVWWRSSDAAGLWTEAWLKLRFPAWRWGETAIRLKPKSNTNFYESFLEISIWVRFYIIFEISRWIGNTCFSSNNALRRVSANRLQTFRKHHRVIKTNENVC